MLWLNSYWYIMHANTACHDSEIHSRSSCTISGHVPHTSLFIHTCWYYDTHLAQLQPPFQLHFHKRFYSLSILHSYIPYFFSFGVRAWTENKTWYVEAMYRYMLWMEIKSVQVNSHEVTTKDISGVNKGMSDWFSSVCLSCPYTVFTKIIAQCTRNWMQSVVEACTLCAAELTCLNSL